MTGKIEAAKVAPGDCIVELVKPANLESVHSVPGPVQHIALIVTDLPAVLDQLAAKGIPFADEVRKINFDVGIRHCFVFGPSTNVAICSILFQNQKTAALT
jgi:catechol 2,3-dioxygenase-like lactoylglutathione lyase family enzyme